MRAVIVREFGPSEVLVAGQAQDPSPGEGEVLVDVELAKSWRTPERPGLLRTSESSARLRVEPGSWLLT